MQKPRSGPVQEWLSSKSVKLPSNTKDMLNKSKPVAQIQPNKASGSQIKQCKSASTPCTPTMWMQPVVQKKPTNYGNKPNVSGTQNAKSNNIVFAPKNSIQINLDLKNVLRNNNLALTKQGENSAQKAKPASNKQSQQKNNPKPATHNSAGAHNNKPKNQNANKPKSSNNQASGRNTIVVVQKNVTIIKNK